MFGLIRYRLCEGGIEGMRGRGVMCVHERDTIDRQTDSLRAIGQV
jgi:hypothetical protein